jgi:Ribbon-helix-helix protein, copG family.
MNLNIRITANQDTRLTKAAAKAGINKSEFVRQKLFMSDTRIELYADIFEKYFTENQKSTKMLLNLILHAIAEQHGTDKAKEIAETVKKIVEGDG